MSVVQPDISDQHGCDTVELYDPANPSVDDDVELLHPEAVVSDEQPGDAGETADSIVLDSNADHEQPTETNLPAVTEDDNREHDKEAENKEAENISSRASHSCIVENKSDISQPQCTVLAETHTDTVMRGVEIAASGSLVISISSAVGGNVGKDRGIIEAVANESVKALKMSHKIDMFAPVIGNKGGDDAARNCDLKQTTKSGLTGNQKHAKKAKTSKLKPVINVFDVDLDDELEAEDQMRSMLAAPPAPRVIKLVRDVNSSEREQVVAENERGAQSPTDIYPVDCRDEADALSVPRIIMLNRNKDEPEHRGHVDCDEGTRNSLDQSLASEPGNADVPFEVGKEPRSVRFYRKNNHSTQPRVIRANRHSSKVAVGSSDAFDVARTPSAGDKSDLMSSKYSDEKKRLGGKNQKDAEDESSEGLCSESMSTISDESDTEPIGHVNSKKLDKGLRGTGNKRSKDMENDEVRLAKTGGCKEMVGRVNKSDRKKDIDIYSKDQNEKHKRGLSYDQNSYNDDRHLLLENHDSSSHKHGKSQDKRSPSRNRHHELRSDDLDMNTPTTLHGKTKDKENLSRKRTYTPSPKRKSRDERNYAKDRSKSPSSKRHRASDKGHRRSRSRTPSSKEVRLNDKGSSKRDHHRTASPKRSSWKDKDKSAREHSTPQRTRARSASEERHQAGSRKRAKLKDKSARTHSRTPSPKRVELQDMSNDKRHKSKSKYHRTDNKSRSRSHDNTKERNRGRRSRSHKHGHKSKRHHRKHSKSPSSERYKSRSLSSSSLRDRSKNSKSHEHAPRTPRRNREKSVETDSHELRESADQDRRHHRSKSKRSILEGNVEDHVSKEQSDISDRHLSRLTFSRELDFDRHYSLFEDCMKRRYGEDYVRNLPPPPVNVCCLSSDDDDDDDVEVTGVTFLSDKVASEASNAESPSVISEYEEQDDDNADSEYELNEDICAEADIYAEEQRLAQALALYEESESNPASPVANISDEESSVSDEHNLVIASGDESHVSDEDEEEVEEVEEEIEEEVEEEEEEDEEEEEEYDGNDPEEESAAGVRFLRRSISECSARNELLDIPDEPRIIRLNRDENESVIQPRVIRLNRSSIFGDSPKVPNSEQNRSAAQSLKEPSAARSEHSANFLQEGKAANSATQNKQTLNRPSSAEVKDQRSSGSSMHRNKTDVSTLPSKETEQTRLTNVRITDTAKPSHTQNADRMRSGGSCQTDSASKDNTSGSQKEPDPVQEIRQKLMRPIKAVPAGPDAVSSQPLVRRNTQDVQELHAKQPSSRSHVGRSDDQSNRDINSAVSTKLSHQKHAVDVATGPPREKPVDSGHSAKERDAGPARTSSQQLHSSHVRSDARHGRVEPGHGIQPLLSLPRSQLQSRGATAITDNSISRVSSTGLQAPASDIITAASNRSSLEMYPPSAMQYGGIPGDRRNMQSDGKPSANSYSRYAMPPMFGARTAENSQALPFAGIIPSAIPPIVLPYNAVVIRTTVVVAQPQNTVQRQTSAIGSSPYLNSSYLSTVTSHSAVPQPTAVQVKPQSVMAPHQPSDTVSSNPVSSSDTMINVPTSGIIPVKLLSSVQRKTLASTDSNAARLDENKSAPLSAAAVATATAGKVSHESEPRTPVVTSVSTSASDKTSALPGDQHVKPRIRLNRTSGQLLLTALKAATNSSSSLTSQLTKSVSQNTASSSQNATAPDTVITTVVSAQNAAVSMASTQPPTAHSVSRTESGEKSDVPADVNPAAESTSVIAVNGACEKPAVSSDVDGNNAEGAVRVEEQISDVASPGTGPSASTLQTENEARMSNKYAHHSQMHHSSAAAEGLPSADAEDNNRVHEQASSSLNVGDSEMTEDTEEQQKADLTESASQQPSADADISADNATHEEGVESQNGDLQDNLQLAPVDCIQSPEIPTFAVFTKKLDHIPGICDETGAVNVEPSSPVKIPRSPEILPFEVFKRSDHIPGICDQADLQSGVDGSLPASSLPSSLQTGAPGLKRVVPVSTHSSLRPAKSPDAESSSLANKHTQLVPGQPSSAEQLLDTLSNLKCLPLSRPTDLLHSLTTPSLASAGDQRVSRTNDISRVAAMPLGGIQSPAQLNVAYTKSLEQSIQVVSTVLKSLVSQPSAFPLRTNVPASVPVASLAARPGLLVQSTTLPLTTARHSVPPSQPATQPVRHNLPVIATTLPAHVQRHHGSLVRRKSRATTGVATAAASVPPSSSANIPATTLQPNPIVNLSSVPPVLLPILSSLANARPVVQNAEGLQKLRQVLGSAATVRGAVPSASPVGVPPPAALNHSLAAGTVVSSSGSSCIPLKTLPSLSGAVAHSKPRIELDFDLDVASPLSDESMSFSPPSPSQPTAPSQPSAAPKDPRKKKVSKPKSKEAADRTAKMTPEEKAKLMARVAREFKQILQPYYKDKRINKEEYKDIMRKAVPRICHSRTGDTSKIRMARYADAYVHKVIMMRKYLAKKSKMH